MKFLRRMAGFAVYSGNYFIARAHIPVPPILLLKVFPWHSRWEVRFRQRQRGKNWANGGLDEQDLAGQYFIDLLAHLRVVLLQDLAVLEPCKCFYIALFCGCFLTFHPFCTASRNACFGCENVTF
jgi:hypothetical protein